MARPNEFSVITQELALARQRNKCASCGVRIARLGEAGQAVHRFGESAQAHHMRPVKAGGTGAEDNCVVICQSCHYSVHEGGNYRYGTVVGTEADYPYYNG